MERLRMESLRKTLSLNWNHVEWKESEWKDSERLIAPTGITQNRKTAEIISLSESFHSESFHST
jgi:hypothetical protein